MKSEYFISLGDQPNIILKVKNIEIRAHRAILHQIAPDFRQHVKRFISEFSVSSEFLVHQGTAQNKFMNEL